MVPMNTNTQALTPAMERALNLLNINGVLYAGGGNSGLSWGGVTTVNARTIDALAARGFCTVKLSSDGGMMAVIVPKEVK
jgi:hypothetical protein